MDTEYKIMYATFKVEHGLTGTYQRISDWHTLDVGGPFLFIDATYMLFSLEAKF